MIQSQLAERIGVTRQARSKWEPDNAIPDSATAVQLARLFSVATDSLLLDALDPTSPPPAPAVPMPPAHMTVATAGEPYFAVTYVGFSAFLRCHNLLWLVMLLAGTAVLVCHRFSRKRERSRS